jgi:antitoxin FitA
MLVNITIRHVPDSVRDEIARRASLRGQSTQEFLLNLLVTSAEKPDRREVLAQIASLREKIPPIDVQTLLERDNDGRY